MAIIEPQELTQIAQETAATAAPTEVATLKELTKELAAAAAAEAEAGIKLPEPEPELVH